MEQEKKVQWVMTLTSIQQEADEITKSVLNTKIEYYTDDNGDRIIAYDESETELGNSAMELRVSPDDTISVSRTGDFQTNLVMQKRKKHFCYYETPFGDFPVGVSAQYIQNQLTDNGGTLEMHYTIDVNSTLLSANEIHIQVVQQCNS